MSGTSPSPARTGILCVVSGPSGSGKTTLCRAAATAEGIHYAVSCTTRSRRSGETDGVDYYFLSEEDFVARVEAGEFLEHAEVHGRRYGTLRSEVLPRLARGEDVVMDLDTQGAAQLRICQDMRVRDALMSVFLLPADMDDLRKRLAGRRSESDAELEVRLRNALREMQHWPEYDYTLISGTREEDLSGFLAILRAERHRSRRLKLTTPQP